MLMGTGEVTDKRNDQAVGSCKGCVRIEEELFDGEEGCYEPSRGMALRTIMRKTESNVKKFLVER